MGSSDLTQLYITLHCHIASASLQTPSDVYTSRRYDPRLRLRPRPNQIYIPAYRYIASGPYRIPLHGPTPPNFDCDVRFEPRPNDIYPPDSIKFQIRYTLFYEEFLR